MAMNVYLAGYYQASPRSGETHAKRVATPRCRPVAPPGSDGDASNRHAAFRTHRGLFQRDSGSRTDGLVPVCGRISEVDFSESVWRLKISNLRRKIFVSFATNGGFVKNLISRNSSRCNSFKFLLPTSLKHVFKEKSKVCCL